MKKSFFVKQNPLDWINIGHMDPHWSGLVVTARPASHPFKNTARPYNRQSVERLEAAQLKLNEVLRTRHRPLSIVHQVQVDMLSSWNNSSTWTVLQLSRAQCFTRSLYKVCGGDQVWLSAWPVRWSKVTSTSVSTWMGDHQGRLDAVNLNPFVDVDVTVWPTVYI